MNAQIVAYFIVYNLCGLYTTTIGHCVEHAYYGIMIIIIPSEPPKAW